ncbi:MAG: DCC1-like thiol-disulfide oxidoreductase family protein [Candidatus Acidiferrales bacterium]|jgi:predicted DCC family thiol-disulfide oxidoreductase YuxK
MARDRGHLPACYPFHVMPPVAPDTEMLFYDGHCGLCHGAVKFVLRHDRSGNAFRFAPLQGPTFEAQVPVEQRSGLPDSIVVLTKNGVLLVRSNAFVHILRRLGGGWQILGSGLAVIPRPVRDVVYDLIARIRFRIFGTRDKLCPIVPPDLRARFDP